MSTCPHCDEPISPRPNVWRWSEPWQCHQCNGLYGWGEGGPFRIQEGMLPLSPIFDHAQTQRFCFYSTGRHYVYALCCPNGLPFYVGRGQKSRCLKHVDETYSVRPERETEKHRLIRELADAGHSEKFHFFALVDTAQEAADIEMTLIQRYGLRSKGDMLVNKVSSDMLVPVTIVEPPPFDLGQPASKQRRLVHHPDVEATGRDVDYSCIVCGGAVVIPQGIGVNVVQCPHCAHFWRPLFGSVGARPMSFNSVKPSQ